MKYFIRRIIGLGIFSAVVCNAGAQNAFFTDALENSFTTPSQKRVIIPSKYRTVQLNKSGLLNFLRIIPSEKNVLSRNVSPVIEVPMPGGGTAKFHIWESSVMEPALAAKYPDIKTFTGQGIDDPTANIKIDFTRFGFHAMIISSLNGAVFIDPYSQGNTTHYISYNKIDFAKKGKYKELPVVKLKGSLNRPASPLDVQAGSCNGTQLRTYRLALAANGEYTAFQGGTAEGAIAAEVTTMNRVNGVYEREMSIRMILVANNNLLVYTNSGTDPYTNANPNNIMLSENQNNIDAVIGNANYDIGHVFSTGGGGVAGLAVVCVTGEKAQGVTGTDSPAGDPYDIDYVAHEMGHQFGANHTFNSDNGACNGNGESLTNAEPGSGSTVMAYAGICGTDDLQANSDAVFHAMSFNEIIDNTTQGDASSCPVVTATGNTPPVVNAGADYIIPKSTPFSLTGSAADANGDVLTYSWEQIDVGGPFGTWDNPSGNAPLFRSFIPRPTPVRFFPRLADVISNNITKGEVLPAYARVMHFRLTARDNRAGGGGVCVDEAAITVNAVAGPFVVTYPNATGVSWLVNDFKTITWNPAGTGAAPVNCANVKIELSTDGGLTFPVTILASTPNDGTEEIQVPNNVTAAARIRITSVGNIFYDMSNANFSIQASPVADFVFNSPVPATSCGGTSLATTLKTAPLSGFTAAINLSATGNPAGTTVTFGASPLSPGSATTVTLNNTNTLVNGTYNITVTGVAGAVNKTRIISFVVNAIPPPPAVLTSPANNATGISTQPSFNWSAVAGASYYKLEISKVSTFSPVAQTVTNITALPRVLTSPLAENTVYYWRVTSTNNCGTGASSATGVFKTGIATCKNSVDAPQEISVIGAPTVLSTITVPAVAGVTINDLNVVRLTGTHSYMNDLTVSLTSPAGTTVVLFNEICPGGAEDFNINLDDEAAIAIPCPPTNNQTARPQNLLSAFDGESSVGTWTLTVKDNANQDGGSLVGWGLAFNECTVIATSIYSQLCPPAANTSLSSDLTGASYQWQVNTGSGFANITDNLLYSGTNTAMLQINNAPSLWNGYQYRCVVDGNNSTVLTLGFTTYWNGSVSNAWENPANWSCNSVPDANTDVIINTGAVVVKSSAICRSIKVNPTSSVTVNAGFKITVAH
ncbi:MAG: zinc-dependent metalloprotease family protein [Ferruginibacter sp.]